MLETIVGILGTAFVGVVGWVITLGTRVSVLEKGDADLVTLIETKFEELDKREAMRAEEANRRLDRIERGMNGQLKD